MEFNIKNITDTPPFANVVTEFADDVVRLLF